MRTKLALFLVVGIGLYAIGMVAPGFRPKEIRDSLLVLFSTQKGFGALAFGAIVASLIPTCIRLKHKGYSSSVVEAFCGVVGFLLILDLLLVFVAPSLSKNFWLTRLFFIAIAFWGWRDAKSTHTFLKTPNALYEKFVAPLKKQKYFVAWALFLFLLFFLLAREQMHQFLNRPSPFGDEIEFWYTASVDLIQNGMPKLLQKHAYTPAIPWLIAFPARLFGSQNLNWVFGYVFLISGLSLMLLVELSKNPMALVAGLSTLFFSLTWNRDLAYFMGGLLYGEACASLLCAVLLVHLYRRWMKPGSGKISYPKYSFRGACFSGFIFALCMLSKPPLAVLIQPMVIGLCAVLFFTQERWLNRVVGPILLFMSSFSGWVMWKAALEMLKKNQYYNVDYKALLKMKIDFSVPLSMLGGLFSFGAMQSAYTVGLIVVFTLLVLLKNKRLAFLFGGGLFFYWGFVLCLYATFWQKGDYNSAGRYLMHMAMACILCLPLVFEDWKASSRSNR